METESTYNLTAPTVSLLHHNLTNSCDYISTSASQYQKKVIPTLYSLIFLLGFLGNMLVVCVLYHSSGRRTVANTYLMNLAMSDLLFLSSLPFWAVYYSLDYNWVFGKVMCKLCGGLVTINVYASIFFITCMSVDRYHAIVYPLHSQSSRSINQARCVSGIIWVVAALTTLPTVVFRDIHTFPSNNVTACVIYFPNSYWQNTLTLGKNTLGFFLPFVVIATCYSRIAVHLLATPNYLEQGSTRLVHVLRMVVAVVLAFFFCWFPFHVLAFLGALGELGVDLDCWVLQVIHKLLPFFLCLGFSNSAINPFLYCFVGNHFREKLWQFYGDMLTQKRDSISTRLSSFSRKLSDLKETVPMEILEQQSSA
ncbi:type-2 angiotensin II receptor-like [Sinocyclocheilus rhinocerous]|uniref:Type-1 angiotensin II receptor n=1 Tax=Sinocyclocheilus rhinocerous TaxID=307959 RepID=A0A673MXN4_9TELE|nr:PREDICTED: type-2 angiotensin II receptor-like [Sinocyclocheilus rhinocerous]XP_016400270.1 PREDICTED: type-2 angiotensin II receptor-like [Sinocyclocheilus rhinocerous]